MTCAPRPRLSGGQRPAELSFKEHIARTAAAHRCEGFTVDIVRTSTSGFFHAIDNFLLIFGDQFALVVTRFFGGTQQCLTELRSPKKASVALLMPAAEANEA